jgi:hypothetical protein
MTTVIASSPQHRTVSLLSQSIQRFLLCFARELVKENETRKEKFSAEKIINKNPDRQASRFICSRKKFSEISLADEQNELKIYS